MNISINGAVSLWVNKVDISNGRPSSFVAFWSNSRCCWNAGHVVRKCVIVSCTWQCSHIPVGWSPREKRWLFNLQCPVLVEKRDGSLFLCTIILRDLWKVCFVCGAIRIIYIFIIPNFQTMVCDKGINMGRIQGRVYNLLVGRHVGLWNGGWRQFR